MLPAVSQVAAALASHTCTFPQYGSKNQIAREYYKTKTPAVKFAVKWVFSIMVKA
jgi:hypothetical protein